MNSVISYVVEDKKKKEVDKNARFSKKFFIPQSNSLPWIALRLKI